MVSPASWAKRRTDYGKGEHTIEMEPDLELAVDPTQLIEMLLETFRSPDYRPPVLPAIALQLMEMSRKPEVTFPQMASLMQQEPLLASQVLRLAQSPVYRRGEPLRTLEQATSRLGMRVLSDLFLQASLNARVFRAPGYEAPMMRLADHSGATAQLARLVCQHTAMMDEQAFLCGLLHDVGTAACMIAVAGHRSASREPMIPFPVLAPVLREVHESASERLAELWQLPGEIRIIIGHHHSLSYKGMIHPLSAVVCIAESLATELGHGAQEEINPSSVLQAISVLNLSQDTMARLRTSAERLLEQLPPASGASVG